MAVALLVACAPKDGSNEASSESEASSSEGPPHTIADCDALGAIDEFEDITPPASNHIPASGRNRTTTLERWEAYCKNGTVSKSDKPDSLRKAFVRAVESLQTRGIIGVWQDYVWLTGQTGQ